MTYLIKPLTFKPPRLKGISPEQTELLYETVYGLEVRKSTESSLKNPTNIANIANIANIDCIKRFELHFTGLGEIPGAPNGEFEEAINSIFGSVDNWRDEFTSLLYNYSDQTGWLTLSWSLSSSVLENKWLPYTAIHDESEILIIVISTHTQSYVLDYNNDATAFIKAYLNNIDWGVINTRFIAATNGTIAKKTVTATDVQLTAEALVEQNKTGQSPIILDVRLE